MSRCAALKERKARREGRANWQFARFSQMTCLCGNAAAHLVSYQH
jgi:hypothetical protein